MGLGLGDGIRVRGWDWAKWDWAKWDWAKWGRTTLCSMYFSKKIYAVYNGAWGKVPENGEFLRILCYKSNLTVSKVTFTFDCKLQKNIGGAGCTSCSP